MGALIGLMTGRIRVSAPTRAALLAQDLAAQSKRDPGQLGDAMRMHEGVGEGQCVGCRGGVECGRCAAEAACRLSALSCEVVALCVYCVCVCVCVY